LRLTANLWETFLSPWVSMPLAFVVLGLAAVGFVAMAWRSRRGLVLLLGLFTPYAILHLLFPGKRDHPLRAAAGRAGGLSRRARHRRADPAAVAGGRRRAGDSRASRSASRRWRRTRRRGRRCSRCSRTWVTCRRTWPLARTPPAVRAALDARDLAARVTPASLGGAAVSPATSNGQQQPVVAMHRRVLTESRRAREWQGVAFPWTVLPSPVGHEWLELEKYWRDGGRMPLWFIAESAADRSRA